jgi:hypothetical protein
MGPDFLCIGAVKGGTTWLHHNLRAHPGAWTPPIKEIRYFDEPRRNLRARLLERDKEGNNGDGNGDYGGDYGGYDYGYWRFQLKQFLCNGRGWLHPRRVWWHLHYFFRRRSPRWYARLFRPAAEAQVAGEATPFYAPLLEERVAFVARHFPDLKLIYLLRDPIDRTWAHVLLRCMGLPEVDWNADRLTMDVVRHTVRERELGNDWLFRNARYFDNLRRWERHFSPDQLFVAFHEELKRDAAGQLHRILRFLDAPRAGEIDHALARKRFNERPVNLTIPPAIETAFAERLIDDLRALAERFEGPPVSEWQSRARHACSR